MTHARTRLPLVGLLAVILILLLAPSLWAQSIPSYRSLAETVAKELGYPNRVSEAGAGQVTREVAARIYWTVGDKTIGLLKKRPGQNQYLGCAIDALLHKPTGITIDIIGSSGVPASTIHWLVQDRASDPRYPESDFVIPPRPTTAPPTDPDTEPDPDPPVDTLTPRVVTLERRVAEQGAQLTSQAAAVAELTERLLAMAERIAALEHAPGGALITCVDVVIPTSRDWGHGHRVTVPVCRPQEH